MRTPQDHDRLREQAVSLRRQGKSLRQIKEILGPMSNTTLHDALRGEPPPEWTRRPNAQDGLRAKARELRGQGLSYNQIAAALGVSKSSVSLWVREDYYGCLRVDVCRSADLYRKIEGWAGASMAASLRRSESADTVAGPRPVSWNCDRGTTS